MVVMLPILRSQPQAEDGTVVAIQSSFGGLMPAKKTLKRARRARSTEEDSCDWTVEGASRGRQTRCGEVPEQGCRPSPEAGSTAGQSGSPRRAARDPSRRDQAGAAASGTVRCEAPLSIRPARSLYGKSRAHDAGNTPSLQSPVTSHQSSVISHQSVGSRLETGDW